MKKITTHIKLFFGLAALAFATSCAPQLDELTPSAGSNADFTKYVAIGNSLTAGFADNGLYLAGQQVAYPNLIAEQMQKFGGAVGFNSPFFSAEQSDGTGYMRLTALVNGSPVIEMVPAQAVRSESPLLFTKYLDPITNLGVPGMRLDMMGIQGYGSAAGNPYFERLLPDASTLTTTYLSYASSQNHTFFSFWLGNNDVLGYATNGAVTTNSTNRLTTTTEFTALYTAFIGSLVTNGRKGVVATIPDVTSIPYFNTVTRVALLAAVNAVAPAPVADLYIATKTTPRAATDKDKFILTFSSIAGNLLGSTANSPYPYGLHPLNPIEDQYVLDESEQATVATRVVEFNDVIKKVASDNDLAVADAYAFLNRVKSGIVVNGVNVSSSYITGNAFSLDGVHLTPLGNALTANLFIDAINAKYKSTIPKVDVSLYRGVIMPN
ncbi:SGNH/GDSL hydrolase family protein [Sphingobacterium hungaricum]|uniref:G-D-S-L family lipolytic protein n=1 Tax=Sphingobacterium hungaricum TaxID=2082723 RepID=A0A928UY82_9SPHI|nr:SGNH/GDSL hydrolase family protein [Sphingobacterium hungaricum]MBE8713289.1 G-D-S-L family lipolytic protein [Sphingobacterium hungaricum]